MFLDPKKELKVHNHDLPHWQQEDVYIFITWRLLDSVPQPLIKDWKARQKEWLHCHPKPWDEKTEKRFHLTFSSEFEQWLDQGLGSCLLRKKENAQIVADCLLHEDSKLYEMDSFVIMPNHVHILVKLHDTPLEKLIQTWKSVTSHKLNKQLGKSGPLWQGKYWDRILRTPQHLLKTRSYIAKNPEKANLPPSDFILWMK